MAERPGDGDGAGKLALIREPVLRDQPVRASDAGSTISASIWRPW